MLTGTYVGVNMEECLPLDGGCNWNISSGDWHNVSIATKEFLPLRLSGTETILSLYSCSMRLFAQSLYLLKLKFNFVGSRYIHRVSEKVFYCECIIQQLTQAYVHHVKIISWSNVF